MQNLTAVTTSTIERNNREDGRKSMLARYSPEQANLFKALSAQDWHDHHPKINDFMKSILSERDASRALDTVASWTRKWAGVVSRKGLTQFFAHGYAATDPLQGPGGFTAFMCRPKEAKTARSEEEKRSTLRSMFGEKELDDEAIKLYAKQDHFLAGSYHELEEQLRTTMELLETFTCSKGIASEGYRHGLYLILTHRDRFQDLIADKPSFCVEFVFLVDTVFQEFINELGRLYMSRDIIKDARRTLRGHQVNAIDSALSGFQYGNIPTLRLPMTLTMKGTASSKHPDGVATAPKEGASAPSPKKDKEKGPAWWGKNPGQVAAWCVPSGKSYPDFFGGPSEENKENLKGWPKVLHHKSNLRKPMCIKFQAIGVCRPFCSLSHVVPSSLPKEEHALAAARFKEVYKS
jgi:hypothetical protein